MAVKYLIVIITAYLLGSLNPAIIISRRKLGQDIREVGSGNAGATNIQRTMGGKYAALVVLLDAVKTASAICFAQLLCYGFDLSAGQMIRLLAGASVIIGHIWPAYYGLKGGKGVMAASVTALFFHPSLFAICFVIFVVTVFFTRYISLGSIISASSFAVLLFIFYPDILTIKIISLIIVILIIVKHRSNIIRLYNGVENRFTFKKKENK